MSTPDTTNTTPTTPAMPPITVSANPISAGITAGFNFLQAVAILVKGVIPSTPQQAATLQSFFPAAAARRAKRAQRIQEAAARTILNDVVQMIKKTIPQAEWGHAIVANIVTLLAGKQPVDEQEAIITTSMAELNIKSTM